MLLKLIGILMMLGLSFSMALTAIIIWIGACIADLY